MAQIFDESLAQTLYQRVLSGDATAIYPLMEHCIPLAEVVATNLAYNGHSHLRDDMVQEGLLKVYEICINRKYDPQKARLFSFLNTTLRNIMIDVTRKEVNHLHGEAYTPASLDDPLPSSDATMGETIPAPDQMDIEPARLDEYYQICAEYAVARFPSLQPAVAADAAEYVASSVVECKGRGVMRTLEIFYSLNRLWALAFQSVVTVRLRLLAAGADCYVDDAVEFAQASGSKIEFTLMPELILTTGRWCAEPMLKYMAGTYVRFLSL